MPSREHQKEDNHGRSQFSSRRGFASLNAAQRRKIASEGGRAAHARGTAHEFTSEEARKAGRKGGRSSQRKSKSQ